MRFCLQKRWCRQSGIDVFTDTEPTLAIPATRSANETVARVGMSVHHPEQRDQAGSVNDPPRSRSLVSSNRRYPVSGDCNPTIFKNPAFLFDSHDGVAADEEIM